MKTKNQILFLAFYLFAAGCATSQGDSQSAASKQFATYKTFAVLPVVVDPRVDADKAKAVIEAAEGGARKVLRAQGYAETSREDADLVFYLHGRSMKQVAIADMNYQPAPTEFGTNPAEIASTAVHRIFVEAYENKSKKQVWMGWVDCSCQGVNPRKIRHEVERILDPFPN